MTLALYRRLLIASFVAAVLSVLVDVIFPSLVSEGFRNADLMQGQTGSMLQVAIFLCLSLIGGGAALVSIFGLYSIRPWAPRLAVFGTVVTVVALLFSGTNVQSGIAMAISVIASYLWSAVVVLAFVEPMKSRFTRSNAG
jgi:hypothetical protein